MFGAGFGLAVTPGTQLIIDGLPADRRTLSAAVNDVTREVGGALGGAVAASVLIGVYGGDLVTAGLPPRPPRRPRGEWRRSWPFPANSAPGARRW